VNHSGPPSNIPDPYCGINRFHTFCYKAVNYVEQRNGKPKVIVDVDNILADFAPVFHEELKKRCPAIPHYTEWNHWNFHEGFLSLDAFLEAANAAQMRIHEMPTLQGAKSLMQFLHTHARVTVASHRRRESEDSLVQWMREHCLPYESLDISFHKERLFNHGYSLIIDDSPTTMQDALSHGLRVASVRCPWNRCMEGSGAFIGESLRDVERYVKTIV
jgi:hypothetical protein